ncbi:MAG: hypothetical protein R3B47_20320 [Bacteroidia bacterium]
MPRSILVLLFLSGLLFARPSNSSLKAIEEAMLRFHLKTADSLATGLSDAGYRAFYQSNIILYRYLAAQDAADLGGFSGTGNPPSRRWKPFLSGIRSEKLCWQSCMASAPHLSFWMAKR